MIANPATTDATAKPAREAASPHALPPLAVRAADAARICGVSPRQWRNLDAAGKVPRGVALGRCKVWLYAELKKWLAAGGPAADEWDAKRAAPAAPVQDSPPPIAAAKRPHAGPTLREKRQQEQLEALANHRRKKENKRGDLTESEATIPISKCPAS